jgi:broad specificity phosphatase PhoE
LIIFQGFGVAEGIPTDKFRADAAKSGFGKKPYLYTPEAGETYEQYIERIEAVLSVSLFLEITLFMRVKWN